MKIAIFISGSGTNMQQIIENFKSGYFSKIDEIPFVLSDNPNALGLEKAQKQGIKTFVVQKEKKEKRASFEEKILKIVNQFSPQIIVLAGFMRIISSFFLKNYKGKIINIHPSLLPSFRGVNAQQQAFDYGVKISGCTTHFVDESLDGGPIILQSFVERKNNDTFETFKQRILKEEHKILSKTIEIVSTETYKQSERYVKVEI
jgi:phosphoribosylglycinamide formyltransferase-1